MAPAQSYGFRDVLGIPGVARLWSAQIVSILGDFLAIFAVISVVTFKMHRTPVEVTMILVAYLLPLAVIGPVAGAFVDRWDARVTMITSDLIRAALVVFLVFATSVNQIYLIFLILSAVSSFFYPAQSITLRTIVPQAGLMSANALMSQAVQVMQIVSPSAAAALVAFFRNENPCFWIDSATFLFSAAMIFTVVVNHKPAPGPNSVRSIALSVLDGMKFIFTHRALAFVILAMAAGMFAIRCFGSLIAVYVRDILAAGPTLYGTLSSLIGVGMIISTQLINRFGKTTPKNHLVIAGLGGAGLAILSVAAAGSVTGTVIGMLAIGFCVAFVLIPATTLMQEVTPKEMLGRVSSSMWSVLAIAQTVALLIAGPAALMLGIRNLYFASGALLLIIAAVGFTQSRGREAALSQATSNQP